VDKVVEVTEDEFYESLWYRSSMIFTEDERRALKEATIGVIGVGGTGGIASEQLVRSGVGAIRLVDPDIFELTNMNRQQFCTVSTLGMKEGGGWNGETIRYKSIPRGGDFPEGLIRRMLERLLRG